MKTSFLAWDDLLFFSSMFKKRRWVHVGYWLLLVLVFVLTSLLWRWVYFAVRWKTAPSPGRALVELHDASSVSGVTFEKNEGFDPGIPGQNAALYYWAAFNYESVAYSDRILGSDRYFEISRSWSSPRPESDEVLKPDMETPRLVQITRPFVDLYLKGSRMPYCVWDDDSLADQFFRLQTELAKAKGLVQLVRVHMRYRIHEGQPAEAIELFESVFRFGAHFHDQSPSTMGWLIRLSTEAIAIHGLAADLPLISDEALRSLRESINELESPLEFSYGRMLASSLAFHLNNLKLLLNQADDLEDRQDVLKYVHQDMSVYFDDLGSAMLKTERVVEQIQSSLIPLMEDLLEAAKATTKEGFRERLESIDSENQGNPFWSGPDRVEEGTTSGGVEISTSFSSWLGRESMERQITRGETSRIRFLMLRAAVAHLLQDANAFAAVLDPTNGEPFDIQPAEAGFNVVSDHSWHPDAEDKFILKVGQAVEFPEGFWEQEIADGSLNGDAVIDQSGNILYPLRALVDEINQRGREQD